MSKYLREIYGADSDQSVIVDVYEVCEAFGVTNSAMSHAIKKMLCTGQRGHKDLLTDLYDIRDSINRAIAIEERKLGIVKTQNPFEAK